MIVGANLKADVQRVGHQITAGDILPCSVDNLVNDRGVFEHVAESSWQDQVGLRVQGNARRTQKGQLNQRGIRAGVDGEIILELAGVGAIVEHVDAGIDIGIGDAGVIGHVGSPLGAVVADQEIADASELVLAGELRERVGADELHAQSKHVPRRGRGIAGAGRELRGLLIRAVERQDHFGGS